MYILRLGEDILEMIAAYLQGRTVKDLRSCCRALYLSLSRYLYREFTPSIVGTPLRQTFPYFALDRSNKFGLMNWLKSFPEMKQQFLRFITYEALLMCAPPCHVEEKFEDILLCLLDEFDKASLNHLLRKYASDISVSMRRELLRRRVNVKVLEHSRWSAVFMQEDPKDALLLLAEGLDPQREDAPNDQNDSGEIGRAPDHEVINEFSLLFWACTREDSVTLEALIKAGADPRAHAKAYGPYERENQHETRLISLYAAPIFAAANARNSACMEFLIRNNHYQPSVDKIPEELLKHLVTHPQNIWKLGSYVPDCENTNVSGRFECLSLLFRNGLDRNASCGDSQTLLAHAAAEGYLCLVRRLHQHGVSIYDDPYGRGTPLIAALKAALDRKSRGEPHADQEHVAMYLMKHGAADPERAGVAATPVLGYNGRGMDDDGQQRNDHDPVMFRRGSDKSMAVLREALKLGNFRLIKELLDHWHDVNYRDSHSGQTGLMLAAANLNLEEPPRMRRPYFGDYHKQLCRPMVCSFLLTSGADLWMADHHGKTSFDHAGAKRETFELATMGRMESQYGKRNSDPEDELLSRYYRPQTGPPCGCCGPCEF